MNDENENECEPVEQVLEVKPSDRPGEEQPTQAVYTDDVEKDYAKVGIYRHEFDNGKLKFSNHFSLPPMFFTSDLRSIALENMYNGGHAFLIASGPSFKDVDKNLLRKPGILTMGLNNSPASFRPNLWTCVDTPSSFLASIWLDPTITKIVPISHIDKPLFNSEEWKDINTKVGDCPNVFYYRRNEVVNTDEYAFEDTINWGNHSNVGGGRSVLLTAIRLLYLLGVRHLNLLGVDFNMDKDNKYHFSQDRNRGSINGNMSTYSSMKKWFAEIRKIFDNIGFSIKNCNKDSKLEAFDFISLEDAIGNAIKNIPNVENEKTDGMYTRKDEEKKNIEKQKAVQEAKKYTEEQKKEAKEKLDKSRDVLHQAKEGLFQYLLTIYTDLDTELYQWAHKLKRPVNSELGKLHDDLKDWVKSKSRPIDDKFANLYDLQMSIDECRRKFKECENEKNKIWGIIK